MRGWSASTYINGLLLVVTCVVVNMCTGPVPASLWPVAEGAGEAVPRAAGEAAARYRGGEAAYGEAAGGRIPGWRTRGGRRGEKGRPRRRAAAKRRGKGASADGIRVIAIRTISGRKLPENSGIKAGYWLTGRGCRDSVVVYLGNRETE
jgi:hypothetical protein